jgi:hypothetical protein
MVTITKKKTTSKKPATPKKDFYESYILRNIDSDGYGVKLTTTMGKVRFLKSTFMSEYGFNVARMGTQKAMAEWLSGLPSVLSLPFYNSDIIKFAQKGGSLPKNPTSAQEQRVLNNYWNFMASKIMSLIRKYKV